ncbi:hypothetical protein [Stappia sp. MMSF_3263]|uniref:hypothetical protein n=1 Tax=Stappia sp. MMSF_3263 TaxID=3046693 RepID=UPI00273E6D88|nr:hypothetical protein [Stappia sp. MMSF_3263]
MADSEISTTVPFVTRRELLTGTAVATAMMPLQHGAMATAALAGSGAFDPALSLWHEWKAAYHHTATLCRKQQGLETQLVSTIGFPQVGVSLPGEGFTISISSRGDIQKYFGDHPAYAEFRSQIETDLAAHKERWDAEDKRIGYSAAKRAERAAACREQELIEALLATPATTLAGIAAKLDAVLHEGQTSEDCTEFPWPELRSVKHDLVRIGQALQPCVFMPEAECKGPYPRRCREGLHVPS